MWREDDLGASQASKSAKSCVWLVKSRQRILAYENPNDLEKSMQRFWLFVRGGMKFEIFGSSQAAATLNSSTVLAR